MNGWTDMMENLRKTHSDAVIIWFLPIIYLCAYFLLNLSIGVLKGKYR